MINALLFIIGSNVVCQEKYAASKRIPYELPSLDVQCTAATIIKINNTDGQVCDCTAEIRSHLLQNNELCGQSPSFNNTITISTNEINGSDCSFIPVGVIPEIPLFNIILPPVKVISSSDMISQSFTKSSKFYVKSSVTKFIHATRSTSVIGQISVTSLTFLNATIRFVTNEDI